jgi:predicted transcriptional regulator
MLSNVDRLRKMLIDLRTAGLDTDEIARRANISRGDLYKFLQGDSRALSESLEAIAALYQKVVTGRMMQPEH